MLRMRCSDTRSDGLFEGSIVTATNYAEILRKDIAGCARSLIISAEYVSQQGLSAIDDELLRLADRKALIEVYGPFAGDCCGGNQNTNRTEYQSAACYWVHCPDRRIVFRFCHNR